jgi:adenylate cyclase
MPLEIERKFLVKLDQMELPAEGVSIKQSYINTASNITVRVRIINDKAYLTLKGENRGAVRSEFEYEVPFNEAKDIMGELCARPFIEKVRYEIPFNGHVWEIDVFSGDNDGLCVAEVEMLSEDEHVEIPSWVVQEVTDQKRYYNSQLIKMPFKQWL